MATTTTTNISDRDKTLNVVLNQIEKSFGKGSIMRLGDAIQMRVETISTGSLTLDLALGGGFPKGRIVEITVEKVQEKRPLPSMPWPKFRKRGESRLLSMQNTP